MAAAASSLSLEQTLTIVNQVIDTEIEALEGLKQQIDARFQRACDLILNGKGRLIVTGMGKSGLVGRKIAATMASTGTPAFFVHPAEAGHGDLGMIVRGDVVLAISNSGNSDEISMLLPVIKHLDIPLISISKSSSGKLPKAADIALTLGDLTEACPMGLAPTTSTTATMVLGDALAIALIEARGFKAVDFALSHPAGVLGKKLLVTVADLMHQGEDLPQVKGNQSVMQALFEMTEKRLGMTTVNCADGGLGIFTDGDLRRLLSRSISLEEPIGKHMSQDPFSVPPTMLASEALQLMNNKSINHLLVKQNDKLVGILILHDVTQAGITVDI